MTTSTVHSRSNSVTINQLKSDHQSQSSPHYHNHFSHRSPCHKDQCCGILCLITVVILWVSSAFVNQAVFTQVGFPKPLFGTCVQASLTILFLIPIAFSFHLRRRERTIKVARCAVKYSPSRLKLMKVRQLIRDLKPRSRSYHHEKRQQQNRTKHHLTYSRVNQGTPTHHKTVRSVSDPRCGQDGVDGVALTSGSSTRASTLLYEDPSISTNAESGHHQRNDMAFQHFSKPQTERNRKWSHDSFHDHADGLGKSISDEQEDEAPSIRPSSFEGARPTSSSFEVLTDIDHHELKQLQLLARTAAVAIPLGIAWFVAQLTFNFSLDHLSVTSTNVMSSTSTLFTLVLSAWTLNESFQLILVCPVILSFIGVLLVALNAPTPEDPSEARDSSLGLFVAIGSSFLYAVFVVGLKKEQQEGEFFESVDDCGGERIDESNSTRLKRATRETCKLFGFIGVVTIFMSPLILILAHITGIETLQLPSLEALMILILSGLFGTVLSNYLWALSVVLLSPIVSTVGVSTQIPLTIIADAYLIGGHRFNTVYIVGTALIFVGVVWVAFVSLKSTKETAAASSDESLLKPPMNRSKSLKQKRKKNRFRQLPTSQDANESRIPLPNSMADTLTTTPPTISRSDICRKTNDSIELSIKMSKQREVPKCQQKRSSNDPLFTLCDYSDNEHDDCKDSNNDWLSSDEDDGSNQSPSTHSTHGGSPALHALAFTSIYNNEIPLFNDDNDDHDINQHT